MTKNNLIQLPFAEIWNLSEFGSDEFTAYNTGDEWTTVAAAGSGSVAFSGTGGRSTVLVTSGGTSNDFELCRSTNAHILPAAGRAGSIGSFFIYANQATNNANVIVGVSSTTALVLTDGAIPPTTSFSGFLVAKFDGKDVLTVISSNGTTRSTTDTNFKCPDGNYHVRIDWKDWDGANCEVTFYAGKTGGTFNQLCDANNVPIKQYVAYSALTVMYRILGAGAGSSNAQAVAFDQAYWAQGRIGTY